VGDDGVHGGSVGLPADRRNRVMLIAMHTIEAKGCDYYADKHYVA